MSKAHVEIILHEQEAPAGVPRLVIEQDNHVHPADPMLANILIQRLNKLIDQHGGNVVDALLSVVPVSG